MPKQSDRALLETIARTVANHTEGIAELRREVPKLAHHINVGFSHLDRFMLLHEKLDTEFASMKADLDRVKNVVRQLGGKID